MIWFKYEYLNTNVEHVTSVLNLMYQSVVWKAHLPELYTIQYRLNEYSNNKLICVYITFNTLLSDFFIVLSPKTKKY